MEQFLVGYFTDYSCELRFAIEDVDGGLPGLRRPQAGAVHAVASHFSLRTDPALVCMPTGSGKTVVILICPYVLAAKRALLITPSTVVRGQIAELASNMELLKRLRVLPNDIPLPRVKEVKKRFTSVGEWEELEDADLVVATPHTISPLYESVPNPPTGLFDQVLVDEAHHEAAKGWRTLLDTMPEAKRVLFSATPFRRDRREIRGQFVYNYTLRMAFDDGVFGTIHLVPANDSVSGHDERIAVTASQILRADQKAGLNHRIMVRTGSKARARELSLIYEATTDLRLKVVTSDKTFRFVKKVIQDVRSGELDGVICVDMLGEGFDLPEMKVAALHAPHKSLAVTLQFIGRFARVQGGTGDASVIAVPEELGRGVEKLYEEDATWPQLLIDFAGTAIGREQSIREEISSFDRPEVSAPQFENLSLYSFRPFCHSKVYHGFSTMDIRAEVALPPPFEIVFRQDSTDLNMTVFVARVVHKSKWTTSNVLGTIEYHLFACYYHEEHRMLFINASHRSDTFYEEIANQLGDRTHRLVSAERMNRVLRGVEAPSFFHVGMKNSTASSSVESYVTKSGTRAHEAVSPQEGKLYNRGHIMAKGRKNNEDITIGFSSNSRSPVKPSAHEAFSLVLS